MRRKIFASPLLYMGQNDAPCIMPHCEYQDKSLSKIPTLNILQSYEHLNWEDFLPNIVFGWEPRALAPDLKSLLLNVKTHIGKNYRGKWLLWNRKSHSLASISPQFCFQLEILGENYR